MEILSFIFGIGTGMGLYYLIQKFIKTEWGKNLISRFKKKFYNKFSDNEIKNDYNTNDIISDSYYQNILQEKILKDNCSLQYAEL